MSQLRRQIHDGRHGGVRAHIYIAYTYTIHAFITARPIRPTPIARGVNALSHRGFVAMLQNGGIIKHTSKDDHTIGHFDLKVL